MACDKLSRGLKKKLVVVPAREWYSSLHELVMTKKPEMDTSCKAIGGASAKVSWRTRVFADLPRSNQTQTPHSAWVFFGGEASRRSKRCKAAEHPSTDSLGPGHILLIRIAYAEQSVRPLADAAVVARRARLGAVPSSRQRSDTKLRTRQARPARGLCSSDGAGDQGTVCPKYQGSRRWSRWRTERIGGQGKLLAKK